MQIKEHFKVGGELQRSLVTRGNTTYRRIARYVDRDGGLVEGPEVAVWQCLAYDYSRRGSPSEWVNVRAVLVGQLEAGFQTALAAEAAPQSI